MKTLTLCFILLLPVSVCSAETEPSTTQTREPDLRDHFVAMQETQKRLSQLSYEEKAQLQPQIRRAELQACQRLKQDRQEGVREDDYLREGGADLLANVLQFERYCETLR